MHLRKCVHALETFHDDKALKGPKPAAYLGDRSTFTSSIFLQIHVTYNLYQKKKIRNNKKYFYKRTLKKVICSGSHF